MGLFKIPEPPKVEDFVNLPRMPDVPDADGIFGPGATDFDDFSTYTACMEKQAIYSFKMLKLQSVVLTGRLMIESTRSILRPMLGMKNDLIKIPEIGNVNLDLAINKITAPKVNPLPKCLASTFTGEAINAGANGMKDILDPFNNNLDSINSLTNAASSAINSAANALISNIDKGISEVNKFMEKTMGNIIAPGDKLLFASLDKFQKFVDDSGFINTYREFNDALRCLKKNCKALENYLIDDSFLYYDDKKKRFIMPVDINSGRVRIAKFFEDLTPEEKRQAQLIELRYYNYLNDKKEILKKAAQKAKNNKVHDDKNPFLSAANAIGHEVKDTFNTLF